MIELFASHKSRILTEEISHLTDTNLNLPKITKFSNSELKVIIDREVDKKKCIVISSIHNPVNDALVELMFIADALIGRRAASVTAVIPYFGYSRHNGPNLAGESAGVQVVMKMLAASGYSEVYTIDIHDLETLKTAPVPLYNISALPLLAQNMRSFLQTQSLPYDEESVVVVSPDKGGIARSQLFANSFFKKNNIDVARIGKLRDKQRENRLKAESLEGDVKGKIAIIVDDIVLSGSTQVEATRLLLKSGADKVFSVFVHHDSSLGLESIETSPILKCFTTNTIAGGVENISSDKFIEVSIAPLIAQALKRDNHIYD